MRDAARTRERILEALAALLAEEGFGAVGVNAVARRAGVDKVLIYRYFGGLAGLFEEFVAQGGLWPDVDELLQGLPAEPDPEDRGWRARLATRMLTSHVRELRRRPATQSIMRWELLGRNALTDELARAREREGMEMFGLLRLGEGRAAGMDVQAAAAILHAGLTYLVLRSATADRYLGIDLGDEAGWSRLESVIGPLVRAVMGAAAPAPGEEQ